MNWKEVCVTLEQIDLNAAAEALIFPHKDRELITQALWASSILSLALLFFVPTNGIIFYRCLQPHFGLPAYSNFIIGFMSFTIFHVFRKIVTKNNLLSVLSNKVCALIAMIVVFIFFMRGGV
jgi:hypothetical protein